MSFASDNTPGDSQGAGCSHIELRRIETLKRHSALVLTGIDPLVQRIPEYDAIGVRRTIRPILITQDGLIIEGEDRVEAAKAQGMVEVMCEIYNLSRGDSLILLLRECRELKGLNRACRIELALLLEVAIKRRAASNQLSGRKLDLPPNLAEDPHIDTREEVARIAYASTGNVDKVRRILKSGIEELKLAVRAETISINAADKICRKQPDEQNGEIKARLKYRIEQRVSRLLPTVRKESEPLHAFLLDLKRSFQSLKTKCELRLVVNSIEKIVNEIEVVCNQATPTERAPEQSRGPICP
jgi:hypothetical protein